MTSTKSAGNKAAQQTPAAPGHLCLCFSPDKAAEHRVTSLADFLQHKAAADAAGSGITWLHCEQPDAALVAAM
ncbi:MAG: hypothetical protein Q4G66_11760 [bacterium]|nr:hypothetical protein [bacterium]